jgi:hypothetical protein
MRPGRLRKLESGACPVPAAIVLWNVGGGPMLLICGMLMVVTAALKPIYGRWPRVISLRM